MFENVCTLPHAADVSCLVTHPSKPDVFAVGLASGTVQTYRLPPNRPHESPKSAPKSSPRPHGQAFPHPIISTGQTYTIDTLWKTHRHKGSCRALAFSADGTTLFSVGTDMLIKAADTHTGRVVAKARLPTQPGEAPGASWPSALLPLNPQALVVGTEAGHIHIFSLEAIDTPLGKCAAPSARPIKSLRPHRTEHDPQNAETVMALVALPPTATSSSKASKSFISVAGSTLAVLDVHRGVVKVSVDQNDLVLSACCVTLRKLGKDPEDKIVVGVAEGNATLWNRGQWDDRANSIVVHRPPKGAAGLVSDDDTAVECMAAMPVAGADGDLSSRVVAVGVAAGSVKLLQVKPTSKGGVSASILAELPHDDRGIEGVTAVAFEAGGTRMFTAGGEIVKIWRRPTLDDDDDDDDDDDEDADDDEDEDEVESLDDGEAERNGNGDARGAGPQANGTKREADSDQDSHDEDDDSDDSEDEKRRQAKKQKKGKQVGPHGHHGVLAFADMD